MQDQKKPNEIPIIEITEKGPLSEGVVEIKKPLLKKPKWKKKKRKSPSCRENYLADHDEGSVKIYNERLQAGLMIFPHQTNFREHQPSNGFAVCPYELVAGKIKWRPRIFGTKREGTKPLFVYDMIHIDEADIKKFLGAMAYIANLVPRRSEQKEKNKDDKPKLSDIDQKIMKFRL